MFSDEVLEKFYSKEEIKNIDLATQVIVLRTIEEVLQEVENDRKFQPGKPTE